jgi:hypothetical protein
LILVYQNFLLEEIRNANNLKEDLIEKVENECLMFQSKLDCLENEIEELKRIEDDKPVEECKNVSDELSILDHCQLNISPVCGVESEKRDDLKKHDYIVCESLENKI